MKRTKKDQSKQFEWQVTAERTRIKKQSEIVPENLVVQRISPIPAGRMKMYERLVREISFRLVAFANYPYEI